MVAWKKLGRVYCPSGESSWAKTHCLLPTADIRHDVVRVYFAACDTDSFGRVGFVDLDINDLTRVVRVAKEPALDLGALGAFDDCGVTPSCVLNVDSKKYLYYIGWQRTQRTPYMLFTGVAVSTDDGETFERVRQTPILDRTPHEPFSRGAAFVMPARGGLDAYYWSCREWTRDDGELHYNNDIRRTHSRDGIHFAEESEIVLTPTDPGEFSVGRPWLVGNDLWYSTRSRLRPYRMGHATREDGSAPFRKTTENVITPSESGWDSDMVCYPCVIRVRESTYQFYNGNGHGRTGFGVAVMGDR